MLRVCEKQCDQCLFSKAKIVSDARKRDILRDCLRNDRHFICHKHGHGSSEEDGPNGDDVVCRGFFDRYSTNLIRIMGRLNGIEFVNHETQKTPHQP